MKPVLIAAPLWRQAFICPSEDWDYRREVAGAKAQGNLAFQRGLCWRRHFKLEARGQRNLPESHMNESRLRTATSSTLMFANGKRS